MRKECDAACIYAVFMVGYDSMIHILYTEGSGVSACHRKANIFWWERVAGSPSWCM